MKRANVLQLTFILIGIVFGIFSLPVIFSLVVSTCVMMVNGGLGPGEYLLFNVFSIVAIALQILACWLLITRSASFAATVQKRSGLGKGFSITTNLNDLLHILLIGTGIYLLLTNLSPFLKAIFMSFKSRANSAMPGLQEDWTADWVTIILNLLLPLILLMFAKPIADYFAKDISEEPIIIEEENDSDLITESTGD